MKLDGLFPFELNNYDLKTLVIQSKALEHNPSDDSVNRKNPVLCPKNLNKNTPVIFYLSGFSSDGWKNFSFNRFESNTAQDIDLWTTSGEIPEALYVFVNAWTKWGGSQFINSTGFGKYEDYITQEIVAEVKEQFPEVKDSPWILFGGSSGGYGALHLGTKYPNIFSDVVALAPDCFFEVSLLPEIYKYLPYLKEIGGIHSLSEKLALGQIKWSQDIIFGVMNLVAMTLCYAPTIIDFDQNEAGLTPQNLNNKFITLDNFVFPINDEGQINEMVLAEWLKHDPICFLKDRVKQIKQLNSIQIFVGNKDEYGLQYGSRQINSFLKSINIKSSYTEMLGTHRSLNQFRLPALKDILTNSR
jgi:predicted esterase